MGGGGTRFVPPPPPAREENVPDDPSSGPVSDGILSGGLASSSDAAGTPPSSSPSPGPKGPTMVLSSVDSMALPDGFCLLERRGDAAGARSFAGLDPASVAANIESRRSKIYVLMEETRQLRVQQYRQERARGLSRTESVPSGAVSRKALRGERFASSLPFLPPLSEETLDQYRYTYAGLVVALVFFGAIVAPTFEVRIGLGGTSYADFIREVGLPASLANVDPIVSSFVGGAVGVLSMLLLEETSALEAETEKRCPYCRGTGYLGCGTCGGAGSVSASLARVAGSTLGLADGGSDDGVERGGTDGPMAENALAAAGGGGAGSAPCGTCASVGRVMCTNCFATGKKLSTEHDVRLDPWS